MLVSSWPILLCSGAASYLLGAVPFGFLIARAKGIDIRTVGSGNIGATNVFRSVGKKEGIATFALDALKGFIPAFALPRLAVALGWLTPESREAAAIINACCAVAGHNWPVYMGFKGGKGVATSAGALLGFAPVPGIAGLASWVIVFLASRYVSVASIAAAAVVAAAGWLLAPAGARLVPAALTVLAVVSIARHHGNIRRLANGTENRFQFGRKKTPPAGTGQ